MKKIVILKIITTVIIAVTLLAAAVLVITPWTSIYDKLYEQQDLEAVTGISSFEAALNYDGILQQIMGRQDVTGLATYASSEDMQDKIEQLQTIYLNARWVCGIGIVLSMLGLIALRNRKWYESLNLGGLIAVGLSLLGIGALWLIPAMRSFIFQSRYQELFGYDSLFTSMLPEKWALYMLLSGLFFEIIVAFVFGLIYLAARKEHHPHKF